MVKYNNPSYIGKKFGFLTIIGVEHSDKYKKYLWRCQCDCGNDIIVDPYKLVESKEIKSCGCYRASNKTGLSRKEYHRKYMKEYRGWLKAHNFCVRCKKKDGWTISGHNLCFECNEKRRKNPFEAIKIEKGTEPKIQKSEWVSYGLCSVCGKMELKQGIRPYANVPYRVCEKCYQNCLKMREAYKKKYGLGIRYITPPNTNTPNVIKTYKKLLNDQKERRRLFETDQE